MSDLQLHSDADLVSQLREGEEQAFTEIYHRYWDKLLAIAYMHTRDKPNAEELVQEVFVSLWNRRASLDIRFLDNYLAVAIKFAVFKHLHRNRRHTEIEHTYAEGDAFQLDEERIDAQFLKEYLEGVVEQLPERCRLVFRYSRDEYKSNAEIAQQLSISEKAVEANITRAIKILRLSLRKAGLSLLYFLIQF
ncbi:RNA polymerase sigma-70 factor [Parapedobacter deserti]|uniref:RNA polymerase sigma-70 factor n=1 Tax=Parapedobacter deserti TaxID=1912957 RepID=A0ABV7JM75_9SPHI